jgi:nicotinamide-nucleotide amidase
MKTDLLKLTNSIGELLKKKNLLLTTAESCTGGMVAQVITAVPGSSNWFERGFVTYSNSAKQDMLGVQLTTLETFGAVSAETAQEMAEGALHHSLAQVSLAITGVAGPDGGSPEKPVGTVCFAWAGTGLATQTQKQLFTGDRQSIREQATEFVLHSLIKYLA